MHSLALTGALGAALLLANPAGAGAYANVTGRVALGLDDLALADVGPVVVYLEPVAGPLVADPGRRWTVRQRRARFSPPFLVVSAGDVVDMANDDAIYHNVFSYSAPNDFDLGLYPAGQSRKVRFRHPGVVKTYCSIHESMNGTIFVAPSPWYDTVDARGRFALREVPAGRYRLRTWSARLPGSSRDVVIEVGQALELDVVLATPDPQALPASPAGR